jgi:hypothetical protein
MEFTREYDRWKADLGRDPVSPLSLKPKSKDIQSGIGKLKAVLQHNIDPLWYDACLETIRWDDVYNPGARSRVPRIYLTNSYVDSKLGSLPVDESFRLNDRPEEKYEIVLKNSSHVVARNKSRVSSP